MRNLNINDMFFITDLIYKINCTENVRQVQGTFLKAISAVVPYEQATFYLFSDFNDSGNPVLVNTDPALLPVYIDVMDEDYTKWMFSLSKSMVYRESDFCRMKKGKTLITIKPYISRWEFIMPPLWL